MHEYSGRVLNGKFIDGKIHGRGMIKDKDDNIYYGDLIDNLK